MQNRTTRKSMTATATATSAAAAALVTSTVVTTSAASSVQVPLAPPTLKSASSFSSSSSGSSSRGGAKILMKLPSETYEQQQSQEQFGRFFRLFDEANAPVVAIAPDGHVTLWNKKMMTITSVKPSEAIGKPFQDFIFEDSGWSVQGLIDVVLSNPKKTVRDVCIPLNTATPGKNVQVLTNFTADVDDQGRVIGLLAIGQDVTEWRVHEKQYARVIMQANAPIIELDQEGRITVWNAKAASLTGYTLEAVMGTPLVTLVEEDFRSFVAQSIKQTLNTGVPGRDFELPLITSTGARVEIMLCLTPQLGDCGSVTSIVAIGQDVTERNAKEMEYQTLIDSANAPIFGVDTEGRIVIFNKKAAEISEYDPEEVMGADLVSFLISEDYQSAVAAVFQKAFQGVETANFEFPMKTKNGRRVEILLNATPRYDHLGQIAGVVGIGQDITERIVQEQEYSRLIDTANAPIFGVDKDYRVTIWNKKAATITEYTNEDSIGEELVNFIHEKFRNAVVDVLSKALEGIETANFEFPLITKSGRRLDILLNATPRYDHSGDITGVVGIGQDVTDRRAQEQEYIRLIDTANAPIFGVDIEGRVNIWNRKAAHITEYSAADVIGANLVDEFIPQDYKVGVGNVLTKAMEGVETANFEFPLISSTGRRVEILLNATPRYDHKGEIIGVVGIGQDITIRIAQEQEYSRLIDTANAPIFGVGMDGLVNIWNKKAAEITQYPTQFVLGKDLVQEFILEEYRQPVDLVFSQAFNGLQTANFNFPLITRSGRRVEILLNATPRYNELGEIVGVVGIGQDITDRIAQEQEYSRLIDTANAPIFGVDEDGLVNIWNKKAAQITQYTPSDVMGANLVEKYITEDYREAVGAVLSKALEGVETANFEFPLMTKAGRRVEILLNATPRFNEHGKVIGMVGIGQDITERIAQEQEYARLIEKANAPIFGVDMNGCVTIWNTKTADITKYTKAEVLGKNLVNNFLADEYRDQVANVLTKALKGDETTNSEVALLTKTERNVNILLNWTARFDRHGQIVGVVGIGQDLTDRIAQDQEYTRLIDTANAPIFGVDSNLCVNIWNKKAAQITQYSTAEVMGENLVETFISPEFRPIVAEVFSKALNGIETANFEFPLITRPGTKIEILLNATPRNDLHGNIVGVVGIGQDITDRIAQEYEYFRLIDTANAPIFGVDNYGCINEWNQKIEEITGYHKSSVTGMSLVDTFIVPESRFQVKSLLNRALIGVDVGEMELPMTTKMGRALLLLVNASSKKDMHGNIRGVIGVGQDYTAKKHMEAAKVNFLASFSHELRTPLNGVLGMLELLREQKLDKVPERYVHIAYVSGSLLLNLINDILDLSKIEAGHMEISSDPFKMEDLLDYSIEIFKFKAREKNIKLSMHCSPSVPKVVVGDVVRMRQILLNLLSNAIKFTLEGSITVNCSVVPAPDIPKTHIKLLFQVTDTGIGMDEEEKSRLFSLFTKLERTRKNNPTGSGLGLAICKQLVELMDGSIDVDSELGEGSEFFFTVILRRLEEDLLGEPQKYPSILLLDNGADTNNDAIPKHARILVVEDNEFNWEVVKSFCTDDNHLLQWETNGRDAFHAYKEHHESYDLVLMDCEMPIMNGYTSTQKIRQFEKEMKIPRIPIVGLTAYAMSGDRKKCLDAGMDEFMVKPISKSTLLQAIRQWMHVRYVGLLNREPSVFSDDGGETSAANLVPASTHSEALDLTRAIADLALEDPMMISHNGGGLHIANTDAIVYSLTTLSEGQSIQSSISDTINNTLEAVDLAADASGRTSFSNGNNSLYLDAVSELNSIAALAGRDVLGTSPYTESTVSGRKSSYTQDYEDRSDRLTSRTESNNQDEIDSANVVNCSPSSLASTAVPEDIAIPDGDPVDYALGVEQCGGNETLFFSLLEKYATVCEAYMKRIDTAYVNKDYVVLRRESHSLKGSSAYVAAMRVSKSAFRVQLATERVMDKEFPAADELSTLASSFELLKKENRLVLGYLRRNFSFHGNGNGRNQPRTRNNANSNSRDDQNACVVM
ncbi:Hybrid signal transduction histidine kinase, partial [Globisporangium splendens]